MVLAEELLHATNIIMCGCDKNILSAAGFNLEQQWKRQYIPVPPL
jgi:hypothetical protein